MADILDTFITAAQRQAIQAPIEQALTLPRRAFISESFFELELERIFSRQWISVCFAEQLTQAGDLLPLEFAGIPLLVVRGEDNELRVFHNIVPYDGCLAVIEPARARTDITTPYHGWRYDLCGRLLVTPYWDGHAESDPGALGGRSGDLVEIRCQSALGMVFVDISGTASAFADYLAPLGQLLSDYDIDDMKIGRGEADELLLDEENLATNWKTHYENWALNVLHEAFTHDIYAESRQIPRVNEAGEKIYQEYINGAMMALSYNEQDFAETYQLDDLPFAHFGKDPDSPPERAFIGSLFPNVHMAVFPYFIHMVIVLPASAGHTRTIRAQFYRAGAATGPEFLEIRQEFMEEFKLAGREDGRVTEAVQKARRSPAFEQQFYSSFWDQMYYNFSNIVLNLLEQD